MVGKRHRVAEGGKSVALDEMDPHKMCNNCGQQAVKQCSQCKSAYYCSDTCQTKQWSSHKSVCKTIHRLSTENSDTKFPASNMSNSTTVELNELRGWYMKYLQRL